MKVTLYSTNCPKCQVLEKKLVASGIAFDIITDPKEVVRIGRENKIMSAPILVVDDKVMSFSDANNWVNEAQQEEDCNSCKL